MKKRKLGKILFDLFIIATLVIISLICNWFILRDSGYFFSLDLPKDSVLKWKMDTGVYGDKIHDSKGKYDATSFNTEAKKGYHGEARYFNGVNSYISTPLSFQDWDGITISLWVKPEDPGKDGLSVILDNGHTANSDFVIQSADSSGKNWLWYCNGVYLSFALPLKKWSHVIVSADTKKGMIQAYVNKKTAGKAYTNPFEFGPTMLTIGKLAKADDRYFKGMVDELEIWDKGIGSD